MAFVLSLSCSGKGLGGMLFELLRRDAQLFSLDRKERFDLAFGTSVSIGHISCMSAKMKSVVFCEDDDDVIPLQAWISYPFSDYICVPDCLRYKRWTRKRVHHNSYHKLAYLHPENFRPDQSVLFKYDLRPGQYVVARFSSLCANHDLSAQGISSQAWSQILERISKFKVIKSVEGERSHKIQPWDMHHLLAFAKMIISDSQTMTVEAAVLGVPAIRINTFIGRSTVIDELEKKYCLALGFLPTQIDLALEAISKIANNDLSGEWQARRRKMLEDKCDFNQWMIDFFEKQLRG